MLTLANKSQSTVTFGFTFIHKAERRVEGLRGTFLQKITSDADVGDCAVLGNSTIKVTSVYIV